MTKKAVALCLGLIAVLAMPVTAFGQSAVRKGTIEVNGNTGLAASFDTVSQADQPDDIELRNTAAGAGLFFYMSSRLGVGVVGTLARVNFGAGSDDYTATNLTVGPAVKLRFGGEKTDLALTGGAGLANTNIDSTYGGGGSGSGFKTSGFYWGAGADASFFVRDSIAFTLGARYQASKVKDEADVQFDIAGFSFSAGFSLFFNK